MRRFRMSMGTWKGAGVVAPLALGWMVLAGGCLLEEAPPSGGGTTQACADDTDCAQGLTCVDGQCQDETKPPVTPDCTSDDDCAAGQVCSTSYGDCMSMCGDDPNMDCPAVCAGVCMEPKEPTECWSDADCAADELCALPLCGAAGAPAEYDDGSADAMPYPCDAGPGVCVKKETPPASCQSDADCAADEMCQFPACDGGTPVPMDGGGEAPSGSFAPVPYRCPPPTEGLCVPKPEPQDLCMSDDDCGPGTHCNAGDVCLPGPQPPCPEGEACPAIAVCYGECVADQQGECQTDADCGPGMACEQIEACPPCMACDPDMNDGETCPPCPPCEVLNQCVPVEPPPSECDSDADCGPGMVCQAVDNCMDNCGGDVPQDGGGAPMPDCGGPCEVTFQCVPAPETFCDTYTPCPDGMICAYEVCETCACAEGEPCDCEEYCQGTCQVVEPPPAQCSSDADCADGEYCQIEVCADCACADGEPCDCPEPACWGTCQPKEPTPYCQSDADCGPGYHCEDLCLNWYGSGDAAMPCPPPQCVPNDPDPGYCQSDADCADGYHCEDMCGGFMDPTDPNGGAAKPCPPPQCVPNDPDPGYCQSDADCADGYHCEDMCGGWYGPDGSGASPPIACPPPQCVPNDPGPTYCKSDEECPAGQVCAEPIMDGFAPGVMICQDATPPPAPACMVTGCSGQICADHEVMTTCEWTPEYACFEYAECGNFGPDGSCGWQMTDAFAACLAQFQ